MGLRSWDNRRLEGPDPPRLSHDGPGLATTPAARGAMTEAILAKNCSDLPPCQVSSLERPHPSSIRLQQCPASPDRVSRPTTPLSSPFM
jgi:hypothetical protein